MQGRAARTPKIRSTPPPPYSLHPTLSQLAGMRSKSSTKPARSEHFFYYEETEEPEVGGEDLSIADHCPIVSTWIPSQRSRSSFYAQVVCPEEDLGLSSRRTTW